MVVDGARAWVAPIQKRKFKRSSNNVIDVTVKHPLHSTAVPSIGLQLYCSLYSGSNADFIAFVSSWNKEMRNNIVRARSSEDGKGDDVEGTPRTVHSLSTERLCIQNTSISTSLPICLSLFAKATQYPGSSQEP